MRSAMASLIWRLAMLADGREQFGRNIRTPKDGIDVVDGAFDIARLSPYHQQARLCHTVPPSQQGGGSHRLAAPSIRAGAGHLDFGQSPDDGLVDRRASDSIPAPFESRLALPARRQDERFVRDAIGRAHRRQKPEIYSAGLIGSGADTMGQDENGGEYRSRDRNQFPGPVRAAPVRPLFDKGPAACHLSA